MKWLLFVFLILLNPTILYCQTPPQVALAQLFLGIEGVGANETVNHNIASEGAVWKESDVNFVISSEPTLLSSSDITIGNALGLADKQWAQFNWKWKSGSYPIHWGLGFYKVTNSKYPNEYFFIDGRDDQYVNAPNPDIWFYYKVDQNTYRYTKSGTDFPISKGSIVRPSELLGYTYSTSRLQYFWENALIVVPSEGSPRTPRIIWGKHPSFSATGYKIFRSINTEGGGPGAFSLIFTINNSLIFEFIDNDLAVGSGWKVYYKVKAFNSLSESEFTNTVEMSVSGFFKLSLSDNNVSVTDKYIFLQNHPNPFNPITKISFSIHEYSFVSLKVYDVLGEEISTLVNENRQPGEYTVLFDAFNLPSGIYFYSLRTNVGRITKKMLFVR